MRLEYLRDIPSPVPVRYPQTAFLSLVPWQGGYIGAYREFTPEKSNVETDIRVQRYTKDFAIDGDSKSLALPGGHDPRSFLWKGKPWALVSVWEGDPNANCAQMLVLLTLKFDAIRIKHDLEQPGKNWMPVPAGENLALIRSVKPFVLLNYLDGDCQTALNAPGEIGEYRGGCNGKVEPYSGDLIGFCHRTLTGDKHTPAWFRIGRGAEQFIDLDPGYQGIVDPTCWIDDKLVCCCSKQSWWIPQEITHRLYRIVQ